MLPPNYMPATGFITDYLLFWFVVVTLAIFTFAYVRHVRRAGGGLRRLLVANALLLATLTSGAFVAGETYFRYVYDETDSYGLTMTNWAWFHRHARENSWGLRDVEHSASRPAGVERIAILGDSFVWGYGVPDPADRFGDRVAAKLTSTAPGRHEVWNAGGIGWSTSDELDWLRRVQPTFKFDRVVLTYCLNDVDDLLTSEERFDRRAVPRPSAVNMTQSFFLDFLWFRFALTHDGRVNGYFDWVTRAYDDADVWSRQRARLEEVATYCRGNDIELDVVVFPLFHSWGDDYPFDAAHDQVADAFRDSGARVLDLRPTYAGIPGSELVVNAYDAHPNERAHLLASEAILRELAPGW